MPAIPALSEATYSILLTLVRPRHGYGIMQLTEELSGGRVHLAAGTLYGALNAQSAKGRILQLPCEQDSRRKEYNLTEKGLQVLCSEVARLHELAGESVPVNRKLSEIFLQLHISEKTGRGVPKITERYGKGAFEFRENAIVVTIPFHWINVMGDKVGDKLGGVIKWVINWVIKWVINWVTNRTITEIALFPI